MTLVKQKRKTYAQPLVKRAVMLRQVAPVLLSGSVSDNMSINTMGQEVQNYDITTGGSGGGNYSFEGPSWGSFDWGD